MQLLYYFYHSWQVSPQLSSSDNCGIRTWWSIGARCCGNSEEVSTLQSVDHRNTGIDHNGHNILNIRLYTLNLLKSILHMPHLELMKIWKMYDRNSLCNRLCSVKSFLYKRIAVGLQMIPDHKPMYEWMTSFWYSTSSMVARVTGVTRQPETYNTGSSPALTLGPSTVSKVYTKIFS